MTRASSYSALDKIIVGRRFEQHPFRRFSRGCIEFAVLVRCLQTAPHQEVARCLNLIDGLVTASLIAPGEGPIDCSKCLAKIVLFAAEIARKDFPDRAQGYVSLAENLVPSQSLPWALDDLEREVGWYVKKTGRGIVA